MSKQRKTRNSVILQHRDYLILKWILDMKISDTQTIHRLFFGKAISATKRRLTLLVQFGFLKVISGIKIINFYVISRSGFSAVKHYYSLSQKFPPRPTLSALTLDHDLKVIKCRIKLDEMELAQNWISDRKLQADNFRNKSLLRRDYIPDGLFKGPDDKIWAFELESTLKTKARLEDKINHYIIKMTNEGAPFSKCLFVCTNKGISSAIKMATGSFSKRFSIFQYNQFLQEEFSL